MTPATRRKRRKTPSESDARRLRRIALTNDWDLTVLVREATGLEDMELAKTLMVLKSDLITVEAARSSMNALISSVPWSGTHDFRELPMWVWRTVLETEARRRGDGFPFLLKLTAKEPSMEAKEGKTPRAARRVSEYAGRTAREVTDEKEIRKIWSSCRKFGGELSFEQAEREHGLRAQKGMTAYRVCEKHEKRRRQKA